MLPVIAIVGRPNVGKSTLFNRLTKRRDALVLNLPGVTRDRQYGEALFDNQPYIVIDTGGLTTGNEQLAKNMVEQSWQAVNEADSVLFLVDGKEGLNQSDRDITLKLRKTNKHVILVINKMDGQNEHNALAEFYSLGLSEPHLISASSGRGIEKLLYQCFSTLPEADAEAQQADIKNAQGIKIALIGRPNVGKSTLTNRILGEERVVVYDKPGTTRDSIFIPFNRQDQDYTIIDTAGVRRRGRIKESLEKFSIIKTLQAIAAANVAIIVIDAKEGLTDQDLHLLGFILEAGRCLVIAVNKWDGLSQDDRDDVKRKLDRKLSFVEDFVDIHFISALHGSNVGHLFSSVKAAYASATKEISTSMLNKVLEAAVSDHAPPLASGRRIKLRYAHIGSHNPPAIIIHGNQTEKLPESYKRYLSNVFRKAFKLVGTPINIQLKSSENPYKDRKNTLTPRQMKKKQRLKKHSRRKSRGS